MTRPRVLLVKPVLPYPPEQGTKVLSFGVIESLCETFDVTVLARILDAGEAAHARALERWCTRVVTVLPRNRRSACSRVAFKIAYTLRHLATGRSMKSLYDCPGAFVSAARELAGQAFDLVIVEYWQLYPLLDVFPADRTVLLTHDVDVRVERERNRLTRGPLARAVARLRRAAEAREEIAAYRHAPRVWTLTGRDAGAVRELSGGRTEVGVMPFGIAASHFVAEPAPRTSREVLFMGAMGADFNRDALIHFVRDIYPAVATLPGVTVTVVGGALPPEVAGFADVPGVRVVGHAPDPRVHLATAACLVVPLRFGGGLRIRILEALAAGLPVVCSPVAVEGMGLEAGAHVLIARTPGEYRDHIARLVEDPASAAALAGRALARVRAAYGPETRGEGLRSWVARSIREGAERAQTGA